MNHSTKIWNFSKLRFLQTEARLWIFNNKVVEVSFFLGIVIWVYFEFFYVGSLAYIKYIALALAFLSIYTIASRHGLYNGYFSGYERGFEDSATKNLDYWGGTHSEASDSALIDAVLKEIENNEEKVSEENQQERANEITKGFSQLSGIILTWRKLK